MDGEPVSGWTVSLVIDQFSPDISHILFANLRRNLTGEAVKICHLFLTGSPVNNYPPNCVPKWSIVGGVLQMRTTGNNKFCFWMPPPYSDKTCAWLESGISMATNFCTEIGKIMVPRLRNPHILAFSCGRYAFHATQGPFFSRSLYFTISVVTVLSSKLPF